MAMGVADCQDVPPGWHNMRVPEFAHRLQIAHVCNLPQPARSAATGAYYLSLHERSYYPNWLAELSLGFAPTNGADSI